MKIKDNLRKRFLVWVYDGLSGETIKSFVSVFPLCVIPVIVYYMLVKE